MRVEQEFLRRTGLHSRRHNRLHNSGQLLPIQAERLDLRGILMQNNQGQFWPTLGNVLIGSVMFAVGLFGIFKLWDIPRFMEVLRTWTLIPNWAMPLVGLLVPLLEASLLISWLLNIRRRWVAIACLSTLVLFAAFVSVHLLQGFRPHCGCAGILADWLRWQEDSYSTLQRDLIMTLLIGVGLWLTRSSPRRPESPDFRRAGAGAGFTLLETLIVIAIVGLLVALLAPSLRSARLAARSSASLSNLRTHAQQITAYTSDFRDWAPYFLDPFAGWSDVRNPDNGYSATVPFFGASFTWNIALASGYYHGDNFQWSFQSPLSKGQPDGQTDYYYSCTFVARPAFWNDLTRVGPFQRGATRWTEVQFPDRKVLLWDSAGGYTPESLALIGHDRTACVDGSAARRPSTVFSGTAAAGGDGPWPGAMHGTGYPIGMHTIDGVRGRDIR